MDDSLVNCPHCQYINDVSPAVYQLNKNPEKNFIGSKCRNCHLTMTVVITMRGLRILETLVQENYGGLGAEVPGGLTSEINRETLRGPEGAHNNPDGQKGVSGTSDASGEDKEAPEAG